MTFVYPAVVTPSKRGTGFDAEFPDLEMCTAWGRDLEEALDRARDAARNWIELEMEEGGELPLASLPEDIELPAGGEVRKIMVHYHFLPDSE